MTDKSERHQRAVAGAVGGAIGAVAGGPLGAATGSVVAVGLEPLLERMWAEVQAEGRRRAAAVVEQAAEVAGVPPEEFVEQLDASERTRLLAASAMSTATRTVYEPKIRALGRVLAAGLDNDCAQIDDEQLLMAALADIEAPHAILLELMVKYRPWRALAQKTRAVENDRGKPDPWTASNVAETRPALGPVLPGLLGTLQRHGLVTTNDTLAKAFEQYGKAVEDEERRASSMGLGGRPPSAFSIRNLPETEWVVTSLGVKLLDRLVDPADGAPELGGGD